MNDCNEFENVFCYHFWYGFFKKLLMLYAYVKIKPRKRGTWWEKCIFSLIMYIHSLSFIIYLIAMILPSTGWLSYVFMLIHLFYCTINAEVLTLGTSLISNFLHAYHVYRCHSILSCSYRLYLNLLRRRRLTSELHFITSSGYFTKWKNL